MIATASSKVLARPDTAYLFAHVRWSPSTVAKINAAIALVTTPEMRNWLVRVDAFLAECDPFKANDLRNRPWHELVAMVRESDQSPFSEQGGNQLPSVAIEIGGRHFALVPWSPRRGCNFQLQAADQTIHARVTAPSPQAPNCYLEIGSAPFWEAPCWRKFLRDWQTWLHQVAIMQAPWKISRLDCAFHTQALDPYDLDRSNFVCKATTHAKTTKAWILHQIERAHQADEYARSAGMPATNMAKLIDELEVENETFFIDWFKGVAPQMITFGTRGRLYARAYNKSKEVLRNPEKRALFTSIWNASGFDHQADVINVEFEICRSWFGSRELRDENNQSIVIDTLADLLKHYDTLCSYLVGSSDNADNKGWLRMVDPKTATRIERCRTTDAWRLIRECSELLPHLRAGDRQHARARVTADHVARQAIKLGARLDAMCGRPVKGEYDLQSMMESMAELVSHLCSYSEHELSQLYATEFARSQSSNFHSPEAVAS